MSVTYKFSCYCQADLGLNLSSPIYYKSLNFSSLSFPFCSKGSMTLLWVWNLERKAESRKKVCLEPEVLLLKNEEVNLMFLFFFFKGCKFHLFLKKLLAPLIIIYLFFWLCWVFVSVRGLPLVAASRRHSSSRCAGLSLSRPLLLRSTGSRRAGSAVVAHGPSCPGACGIFPDQGSNPCPLH